MILQALAKYYDRMIEDGVSNVEPEGFKRVAIPFIIVLNFFVVSAKITVHFYPSRYHD